MSKPQHRSRPEHLRRAAVTALLVINALLGAAAANTAPTAVLTDIQTSDAWIRWLPGDIPAAGYVTLVNSGATDHVLILVTSPDYEEVGMHQTQDDNGVSTMRPVAAVTLQPGTPFRFSEGGYHLMLMRPRHPIHPGQKVVMTFHFREGATADIVFDVRAGG